MSYSVIFDGNDHVVEITGLKDQDDTVVTTATVEMTLLDGDTEVAGQSWPVTLTHDGNGDYSAILENTIEVSVRKRYTLKVTAVIGGTNAEWREYVIVQRRAFTS